MPAQLLVDKEKGILARIIPVKGGDYPDNSLPEAPGEDGEHVEPPIYIPELPEIPVQPLPPTYPPISGGGNKPPGVPVLPMDPSIPAPVGPPHPPGSWVTVDAGKRQPPAWAFIPKDDGLGVAPTGGAPAGGPPGHWVPVGKATATPKSAADTTWAWVPEIGPQFGIKQAQPK